MVQEHDKRFKSFKGEEIFNNLNKKYLMKKSFYVKMHPAVHLYTSKALMSLYSKRKDY